MPNLRIQGKYILILSVNLVGEWGRIASAMTSCQPTKFGMHVFNQTSFTKTEGPSQPILFRAGAVDSPSANHREARPSKHVATYVEEELNLQAHKEHGSREVCE